MSTPIPVLIAGAGPSGLVLALTLAKNGVPVRIIEKDTKYHVGQRGAGIQPRSQDIYGYLGTLPDVVNAGRPNLLRCIYEMPGGTVPAKIYDMTPFNPPTPSVPNRNPIILGQAHNEEILRAHLAKHDVYIELCTELVGFEQSESGVTAHIVKHENGNETQETVHTRWLVGADGARSIVRKQLGLTFLGDTRQGEHIVIGDLEVKNLSRDFWHTWGSMSTKLIYLRPTEYDGIFSLLIGGQFDRDALINSREALLNHIRETTNRHELEFGIIKWLSDFKPNIRMVNKFGEGNVFIVGDAAHVHSPTGGQGMNTGVQDAFNLGWKLSLVYKGHASPSLLETYSEERLPVIDEMLNKTTVLLNKTLAFKSDGSNTASLDRPKILHMLGVNCRSSGIVVDEQPDAADAPKVGYLEEDWSVLYAGDRAPDASRILALGVQPVERSTLFKIFGPTHHTALVYTNVVDPEETKAVLEAIQTCPAGSMQTVAVLPHSFAHPAKLEGFDWTILDTNSYALAGYPPVAKGFGVIIVRPDGVVGAIVKGAEGVKRYLSGVFKL
ncbi:hypothetical protein EW026_g4253 [Hermanssonia centrifuga]|uniref:FAD-binding domain-containing protein n=1 Tax=Hermanssonia centrifuga TaxID=98765 RepID=A0A4S4KHP8_9APHY|nr:hypothetical protein EW026_g4253 [Hermanssonia centrifuga]